jgi:hypothetical protein
MNTNQQILINIDAKVQSANAATSLRELKQLTRELQSEALKYQGVNEEAFQAAQQAAAGLVDKMDDVREAISAAKGEPLEQLNSGFSLLKQSVFDLDFGKATLGINTMAKSIKSIEIGKLKDGFTSFASSLATLGKSLLTNPIFLLGSAIALIILNFDKLTKLLGPVGMIFRAIGAAMGEVVKLFDKLTDSLGLTSNEMDKLASQSEKIAENLSKSYQHMADIATVLGEEDLANVINAAKLSNDLNTAFKSLERFTKKYEDDITNLTQLNKDKLQLTFEDSGLQEQYDNLAKKYGDLLNQQELTVAGSLKKQQDLLLSNLSLEMQLLEKSATNYEEIENRKLETFFVVSKQRLDLETENLNKASDLNIQFGRKIKKSYEEGTISSEMYARSEELYSSIMGVIIQKYTELINKSKTLDIDYEKGKKTIALKFALEKIQKNKEVTQKEYETAIKEQEKQYKKGSYTFEQYEDIKLSILLDSINKQKKFVEDEFNLRIKQAKGNNDLIVALEAEKNLILKSLNIDYDTFSQDSLETRAKNQEEYYKEVEKYTNEMIELRQRELESQKNQFEEQVDMDASELQRLNLGKDKFKLNTEERIDIVNDMYVNQAAALRTSMKLELNQVDLSEERKQQIREKYAEKQKLLTAQTADAKLQIEQDYIQRQVQNMQYGADMMNSIGDFMTEMDNIRRDSSGKLDLASQRAAFVRNKTLQTGAAIMNTAAGITNALSTQNYAGAVAIGIAGAAQLAKILATRFEPENGGSSSGGTSATGGGGSLTPPTPASAPSAPLMGQGYLNQQFNPMTFGGAVGFKPGGEQRVFVLEQDITSMQNRVKVMTGRSTLSGTV